MSALLLVIVVLSLFYGYFNGVHSSANIVATIISSRALHPRISLLLATLSVMVGPFLLGDAVADTIGQELIAPTAITAQVITSALLGAIIWSGLTLLLQIPSSISQALFGGLFGAVIVASGHESIRGMGLLKVLIALFLTPILGIFVAFLLTKLVYFLSRPATPHINRWFNVGQVMVSILMAFSFGANDGHKLIAMLTLGLIATNWMEGFRVLPEVILISAASIGIGTLVGGQRLIHTLGSKFYKIRPVHGFGAQLTSGIVIFSAGVLGGPVSGSQIMTSSILGAGSADRIQKVRWKIARQILIAWVLTIPCSALVSAISYIVMDWIKS